MVAILNPRDVQAPDPFLDGTQTPLTVISPDVLPGTTDHSYADQHRFCISLSAWVSPRS
jgi:hypothetical protein